MNSTLTLWTAAIALVGFGRSALATGDTPEFLLEWGSNGAAIGQISGPHGIEVDAEGDVYLVDTGNNRIQKFSSDGTFIMTWGSPGSGPGEFNHPHGVGFGPGGDLFVAETGNNRVQRFTSDGTFVTMWGSFGTGNGQFQHTHGLAVDSMGNVFVADRDQDRVQKFTSTGTFILAFGGSGTGDGQFTGTNGVAVDAQDNVFVGDSSPRIQKFTNDGVFITAWGSAGIGDGQFNFPRGLSTDEEGNVFVADRNLSRMQMFTNDGAFLTKWGTPGPGAGEFSFPYALRAAQDDLVYVADSSNHRIQKFHLNRYHSLCAGDGGDQMGCTDCPCGNNAPTGTVGGCLNSASTSARLWASGASSVSLPTGASIDLRFGLEGAPAFAFGVLTSGNGLAPLSLANPCFGLDSGVNSTSLDGLRCAVKNVRRHGGRAANGAGEIGTTNSPWGGDGPPVAGLAVAFGGFAAGSTRFFQVAHRESPLLGCGRGLNTSQAVAVGFTP